MFATGVATELTGLFAMVPSTWDGIFKLAVIVAISLFSKFASLYMEKHWGNKPTEENVIQEGEMESEAVNIPNNKESL